MGPDDRHHKRRIKGTRNLQRRKAKRSSYDKVLIVCEGEKTEPHYFNKLIEFYKLNTANVEVDGACGSSPSSVFEHAVHLSDAQKKKGDPFDRVYCVFDKDSHETFDQTIRKISEVKPKKVYHAAVSVPCFEYWLLLHFQYTTRPYAGTGKLTIANEVLKDLKKAMPDYTKGSTDIFNSLVSLIETAKENATRSLESAIANDTDNPTTHIHDLVDYLQNLNNIVP